MIWFSANIVEDMVNCGTLQNKYEHIEQASLALFLREDNSEPRL